MSERLIHFAPAAPAVWLLRAALHPSPTAAEAWRAWSQRLPLDDASPADYALLPLVYTNLSRLGAGGPDLGRLRGIYRKTWVENQLRERALAEALSVLHQASVPALVPGGVALARGTYADFGARVCDDSILLLPPSQAAAAQAALRAAGWRQTHPLRPTTTLPHTDRPAPPRRWQSPNGKVHLDLGTHLLRESRYHEQEHNWWAAAAPITLHSVEALTLSPADHLLWACVLGVRGNSASPLRWAADAWHVMMRGDVDWGQLVETAAALRLAQPLAAALKFLQSALDASAPAELAGRLQALPLTPAERRYFRLNARPRGPFGEAPVHLADYGRLREQGRVRGLAAFLRDAWGLANARQVPAHALRQLAVRARPAAPAPE